MDWATRKAKEMVHRVYITGNILAQLHWIIYRGRKMNTAGLCKIIYPFLSLFIQTMKLAYFYESRLNQH